MAPFSAKLARLMRAQGETTRSLGKAVGVSSAAVTGWISGAKPRPEVSKRIATYFNVGLDWLLNDNADSTVVGDRDALEEPLQKPHGSGALEASLDSFLKLISGMRAEAERAAGGSAAEATKRFDRLLATWLSVQQQQTQAQLGYRPPSPEEMRQAERKLEELRAQAEAELNAPPAAKQRRHA